MTVYQYTFGEYVDFWDNNQPNYVSPKYNDLKEELLENPKGTIELFNGMIKKAQEICDDIQHQRT